MLLRTLRDTDRLARRVAATLRGGEVLALTGPLGAGKTTFTQYLAKALGVTQPVRSPTFIVLQTFSTKGKARNRRLLLCHLDAYRVRTGRELEALGLHDYLGQPHVVTVVEWAENVAAVLPPHTHWLQFAYHRSAGEQRRVSSVTLPRARGSVKRHSRVTRNTSSSVVRPASAFKTPS